MHIGTGVSTRESSQQMCPHSRGPFMDVRAPPTEGIRQIPSWASEPSTAGRVTKVRDETLSLKVRSLTPCFGHPQQTGTWRSLAVVGLVSPPFLSFGSSPPRSESSSSLLLSVCCLSCLPCRRFGGPSSSWLRRPSPATIARPAAAWAKGGDQLGQPTFLVKVVYSDNQAAGIEAGLFLPKGYFPLRKPTPSDPFVSASGWPATGPSRTLWLPQAGFVGAGSPPVAWLWLAFFPGSGFLPPFPASGQGILVWSFVHCWCCSGLTP